MAQPKSEPEAIDYNLNVDENGSVTLPVDIRERFQLSDGDKLILTVQPNGEMKLVSMRDQVDKTYGMYAHLAPGRSLVDELIAERREEARREELE